MPAFVVSAPGVAPLELTAPADLVLAAGRDLTVARTPADPSTRLRVALRADNGHGSLLGSLIECDAPDAAGAIRIPAAMLDRHTAALGCGICLPSSIVRYRGARGDAAGRPVRYRGARGDAAGRPVDLFVVDEWVMEVLPPREPSDRRAVAPTRAR